MFHCKENRKPIKKLPMKGTTAYYSLESMLTKPLTQKHEQMSNFAFILTHLYMSGVDEKLF
jgi:hypothetical protein